jgi:hypothetical protein
MKRKLRLQQIADLIETPGTWRNHFSGFERIFDVEGDRHLRIILYGADYFPEPANVIITADTKAFSRRKIHQLYLEREEAERHAEEMEEAKRSSIINSILRKQTALSDAINSALKERRTAGK